MPKSTLVNKAKLIRDVVRIGQMEPEFCRRELLASNPMAWMISVDGFIVDARPLPRETRAELRRRGLIPDLPVVNEVREPGGDAPAKGLAVCDVVDILRRRASGSNECDAWDRIVRIIAEQDSLPYSEVEAIETAIAEAYRHWSDADRRSIWYENRQRHDRRRR